MSSAQFFFFCCYNRSAILFFLGMCSANFFCSNFFFKPIQTVQIIRSQRLMFCFANFFFTMLRVQIFFMPFWGSANFFTNSSTPPPPPPHEISWSVPNMVAFQQTVNEKLQFISPL